MPIPRKRKCIFVRSSYHRRCSLRVKYQTVIANCCGYATSGSPRAVWLFTGSWQMGKALVGLSSAVLASTRKYSPQLLQVPGGKGSAPNSVKPPSCTSGRSIFNRPAVPCVYARLGSYVSAQATGGKRYSAILTVAKAAGKPTKFGTCQTCAEQQSLHRVRVRHRANAPGWPFSLSAPSSKSMLCGVAEL